jgi:predicted transcriptional regulator
VISSLHVLEVISDQISVNMLNAIAMEATNSENLMQIFNLTRKQYYDRSSRLLNIGLIRRKKGKFYLTSFGQLVHHSLLKIASASKHSSELRAIDILCSDPRMPEAQQKSLIDNLIDDPEIKRSIIWT